MRSSEVIVGYTELCYWHWAPETEENYEKVTENCRQPGKNRTQIQPEYMVSVLPQHCPSGMLLYESDAQIPDDYMLYGEYSSIRALFRIIHLELRILR
jgi:hypothetical protein